MDWSREDVFALKMGAFWGDTAEEIASFLSKDVADVLSKAGELGVPIKRLKHITGQRLPVGQRALPNGAGASPTLAAYAPEK